MKRHQKKIVKLFVNLLKQVYASENKVGYNYKLRLAFMELLTGIQKASPSTITNEMFYEIVDNLPDS